MVGSFPVYGCDGMVATSHFLSSRVALDVLREGGNALDAAISACAVQCVVEPGSTGIGGDNFCMYALGGTSEKIIAYNGSGYAPAAATLERLKELGVNELTRTSPHSVIIPGAVDAWCRLHADYGSIPLSELLSPAISYARKGYPVSERIHLDWTHNAEHLSSNPNLARTFLPVPPIGSVHKNVGLADALELIGKEGRSAFYEGELAREIVETLESLGGLHTLDDFSAYEGKYVTPIASTFRDLTVLECPPNGQGVIALLLLNMFEHGPTDCDPLSVDRQHFELEACRRAYGSRGIHLGDPDHSDIPVASLLSKDYAKNLVSDITDKAGYDSASLRLPPHKDTVYISVVDEHRNACSFINTLFFGWGSGITTPRHNIVLTNRGEGFVLEPGHPNCIAPHKRPLHTIIPAMATRDNRVVLCFGVMGGEYQAMGQAQFLSRYVDFRLDLQTSQKLPRCMVDPYSGVVEMESPLVDNIGDDLRERGHNITISAMPIGGSQAIFIDWDSGVLVGGSDPRKDGCALSY